MNQDGLDRTDSYAWSFRHIDGEDTYHYQVLFLNEGDSRFVEIHHGHMTPIGSEEESSCGPTMTMCIQEAKQLLRALRCAIEKADRTR